jgi:glycosyltransferase involved in cell wall biosynthesis
MTRIRIAFFIDALKFGAGTENQLLDLLARLDSERFETTLYTLRVPVEPELAAKLPGRCECLNLGSLRHLSTVSKFIRVVRFLRRERIDIAMIYFVDSQLLIPLATRLSPGTKCVVNRRDMGYWYTPGLLGLLRRVNRWVDYFLVNARAIKRRVSQSEDFPLERIKVIHNALAVNSGADKSPSRTDLKLPTEAPLVGLVANLRPVKRIDRFLDVAALIARRHDRARFVILGGGELRDELTRRAEALALSDKVMFVGSVPEVSLYLKHFAVGVLTSESEGLSNTLIEYSAHRLPVVAFDTGGNAEVVDDKATGYLVGDGDLDSMASRIVELLDDPDTAERLGRAGYDRVKRVFAPETIHAEFEDFLETIARSDRKSVRFN